MGKSLLPLTLTLSAVRHAKSYCANSAVSAATRTASSLIIMIERCRAKASKDTSLIVQVDYLFSEQQKEAMQ